MTTAGLDASQVDPWAENGDGDGSNGSSAFGASWTSKLRMPDTKQASKSFSGFSKSFRSFGTSLGASTKKLGDQVGASTKKLGDQVGASTKKLGDQMGASTKKFSEQMGASTKKLSDQMGASTKVFSESTKKLFNDSVATMKSLDVDSNSQTDVYEKTEAEALQTLKDMIESEKPRTPKRPQKWNFATAPTKSFEKSLDDLFMAFIRWARVDEAGEHLEEYNVSKAFRRLASYATWMDNTGRDMIDPPLKSENVVDAWKTWNVKVSYDKGGRMIVWFDMSSADLKKIRDVPVLDSLRLFVWLSHLIIFDPRAQTHGVIFVESLGQSGFWDSMNLMQPKLALKLDRLTIGTMPIHARNIYICESPQWAKVVISIIKPFLGKIMKQRIVTIQNASLMEDILGKECIPTSFPGCSGELEKDVLWAAYFTGL